MLAAPLDQGAVGIKEKLGVVQGSAVTLVDADGHDNSRLLGSVADGVGGRRRHRHRLVEQLPLLRSDDVLEGGLDSVGLRRQTPGMDIDSGALAPVDWVVGVCAPYDARRQSTPQ